MLIKHKEKIYMKSADTNLDTWRQAENFPHILTFLPNWQIPLHEAQPDLS